MKIRIIGGFPEATGMRKIEDLLPFQDIGTELSLSFNPIGTFDDRAFAGLDKLEYLCLSGVPVDAWQQAEQSQFLCKHLKNIKRVKFDHQ